MSKLEETYIKRTHTGDEGTFGVFSIPSLKFSCFVLELPWRDNKAKRSCIPPGRYLVRIRQSPKYGRIFHLTDVQGRSYILIHWGNFAGDVLKGWRSNSEGCLLFGEKVGTIKGQRAILNSRVTVQRFMTVINSDTFYLNIA